MKLLISITFLVLLVACAQQSQDAVQIKIGANLFLTGNDFSYYAEAMQQGMDLAKDEINTQGGVLGRNLTIIYEDDQLDSANAVTAAQKLTSVDKVSVSLTGLVNTVKSA